MKRLYVLGVLLAIGAASVGVRAYQQPAQNAPKVIDVDKIGDRLWVLKGGGGNTAVFLTMRGVVVVDAKNPGWGQPILDKIKTLTDKPVYMLINTHTHGDHVSGNVEFPATVDVVTQANTKANMEKMDIFKQNGNRGMAKRTFTDKMTIGKGPDRIDLHYFGRGHTNGDAWVVFPALRVAHAGDMFWQRALPLVDGPNGGSVLHFAETLQKAHDGLKNVDQIINGHNPTTTTPADLQTFADFNKDFLKWAQAALKAGKTPEAAAPEWKIPEKYTGYSATVNPLFGGVKGMLETLQTEMKK
ncbi:MAG: MBL fold metallo-hydrolase [Acidobacteria bacterium]|nr:MBL fold metallo-hydrolase [Acidobacteriota bacterium]